MNIEIPQTIHNPSELSAVKQIPPLFICTLIWIKYYNTVADSNFVNTSKSRATLNLSSISEYREQMSNVMLKYQSNSKTTFIEILLKVLLNKYIWKLWIIESFQTGYFTCLGVWLSFHFPLSQSDIYFDSLWNSTIDMSTYKQCEILSTYNLSSFIY